MAFFITKDGVERKLQDGVWTVSTLGQYRGRVSYIRENSDEEPLMRGDDDLVQWLGREDLEETYSECFRIITRKAQEELKATQ